MYKHHLTPNWYTYIGPTGNKIDFTENLRPGMYADMQAWVAAGNEIEPAETKEEKVERLSRESRDEIINANNYAKEYLNKTDWLVIRHSDQLALGIQTSLTNEEYLDILTERQAKRDSVQEE